MNAASLKEGLSAGRRLKGLWLASGSVAAAEIAARAGFDWCLIDLEHGLASESDALAAIRALSGSSCAPIVRVPESGSPSTGRCLDFGAKGAMAPMVENAGQARAFAKALRYPPEGIRGMSSSSRAAGFGFDFERHLNEESKELLGVVQIETAEGVKNAKEIAAVEGVDVLFIGHSDLSLQLGCFKKFDDPRMLEAEERVLEACSKAGKSVGAILRPASNLSVRPRGGLFALGSDLECMRSSFSKLIA